MQLPLPTTDLPPELMCKYSKSVGAFDPTYRKPRKSVEKDMETVVGRRPLALACLAVALGCQTIENWACL